jgi:vacuolar-type H+-ATPase subunit E/Vma4
MVLRKIPRRRSRLMTTTMSSTQKKLTAEEQAEYDAWFIRRVETAVTASKQPDAVVHSHEDVMAMMWEILEERIAKASKSGH